MFKKKRRIRPIEARSKEILTEKGAIRVTRQCYACRYCGFSAIPVDEGLGIATRNRTPEAERKIATLGQAMPFEEASKVLRDLTGLLVCGRTVEEVTEAVGREIVEEARQAAVVAQAVALPATGAVLDYGRAPLIPLYIGMDGTMVPMRPADRPKQAPMAQRPGTHREMRVGMVFWGQDVMNVSPGRREIRRKHYVATMGSVDEFGDEIWSKVVAVSGTARILPVVIGDGAPWIERLAQDHYPGCIQILDLFHVLERICELANALFGQGTLKAQAWVKKQEARLRASQIDEVLVELEPTLFEGLPQEVSKKISEFETYVRNQRHKMDYARYEAMGLMLGSGPVESTNRRVVGMRLKQAGMHWSVSGANEVAHVRALYLSDGDGWDRHWRSRSQQQAA